MRGFRRAAAGVAGLLVVAGAVAGPASAEEAPAATPVALTLARGLDPARWCRPVVSAAVDPAPLHCWLALAAADPTPATVAGINFGDLPAWGAVDVAAIGAELDRYQAEAEAAAAAAAAAARTPTVPTSGPPSGRQPTTPTRTSGADLPSDPAELERQCFELEIPAACDAYFDYVLANPGGGSQPPPAPAPEPEDQTEYELIEYDVEEDAAWWAEMGDRAQQAVRDQCGSQGGRATWDMAGNITVFCN